MALRFVTLALFVVVGPNSIVQAAKQDTTTTALIECAPTTYEAALTCLDRHLPQDVQAALAKPDGALEVHFGLGMWIRNNWGLWQQGALYRAMQTYGLSHPDDMSAAILDGFAARERGESYDVAAKAVENQANAKKLWDEAVKDVRAGSMACPDDGKPSGHIQTETEIRASMEKCFDHIAKQVEQQLKSQSQ